MVHSFAANEDDAEDRAVRELQTQFAAAARTFGDVVAARAALSVFAVCTARLATSPDDALEGAKAAIADIEDEIRELWLKVHGQQAGGTG